MGWYYRIAEPVEAVQFWPTSRPRGVFESVCSGRFYSPDADGTPRSVQAGDWIVYGVHGTTVYSQTQFPLLFTQVADAPSPSPFFIHQ